MSSSRAKIARLNTKDEVSKESAHSTISKLPAKTKNDKSATSKTPRLAAKLPRLVKQRSLSQPSSSTVLNSKSSRPLSVDNKHGEEGNLSKEEKTDEDTDFCSTTILHMPEHLTKIDEKSADDCGVSFVTILESSLSETKNNVSGIPLRIKNSQASTKESHKTTRDSKKLNSTSRVSSRASTPKKDLRSAPSNTLMAQFETKKKRLLVLKEELNAKHQLTADSYKALVELKKKLERSGIGYVVLEDLDLEENKSVLDPSMMENMKSTLNEIPRPLMDLCRELMKKRKTLIDTLDNFVQKKVTCEEVEKCLKEYKKDSEGIEKEMLISCEGQQSSINRLIQRWSLLSSNAGDASNIIQQVEELQDKLREQELKLEVVTRNLQQALELNEAHVKKVGQSESTIHQLKDKIKNLEHDLTTEKGASQSHKEKFSTNDQKLKTMKTRIQELEAKCKDSEGKCSELQKSSKHAQEQIKSNEHRWQKEKEELLSKNKHDKLMLDKITKDRSCFETRAKTGESRLRDELEETRKTAAEEKIRRETLQEKYDQIHSQLVEIEIRNKQAVDIVNTRNTYEPKDAENISTEREVELYTELLATRVGLKAAEEKVQMYQREKIRFLDTIQLLQGEHTESIATLQNIEKLSKLEEVVNEKDDTIYRQKIEISSLTTEVEQLKLKEKSVAPNGDNNEEESELKLMLREGKTKLEQLIKKSTENEQKAINFKHDLDKRSKQLCEMENLLKARDELLTVMKLKKDELQIENNSLNKYSTEIRELLIQSREEARNRNELVQELTMNLDNKGRACEQLEKMIRELEYSLTITNEKRFKLQESIGAMEKELQSTKAHIISITPEAKINRYGIIKSCRNFRRPNSTRNRLFTQKNINCDHTDVYSETPSTAPRISDLGTNCFPKKSRSRLKRATSNSSCNSQKPNFDSNSVRSWLNSYQNMEDIEKRLKFLKRAFNSLSKKINDNDEKLKQSPFRKYARVDSTTIKHEFFETPKTPTDLNNLNSQRRLYSMFPVTSQKLNSIDPNSLYLANTYKRPYNHLSKSVTNSSCNPFVSATEIQSPNTPVKQNFFCTKASQHSSLNVFKNTGFGQTMEQQEYSSDSPNSSLSTLRGYESVSKPNKLDLTSIPIPKPRCTPLTLPTRTFPFAKVKSFQYLETDSQIPVPKQIRPSTTGNYSDYITNLEEEIDNAFCYTNFNSQHNSTNISDGYSPRLSTSYSNSNNTYNTTKKQLEQAKSTSKTPYQSNLTTDCNFISPNESSTRLNNVPIFKRNCWVPESTTIRHCPKYGMLGSRSDSGQSTMSISAVVNYSEVLNNLSKNCSDLVISKKEYVLKLFTQNSQNVCSESDIGERRGCTISNELNLIDNDILPSITFAESRNRVLNLSSGLEQKWI